jgi:hypothetical protein
MNYLMEPTSGRFYVPLTRIWPKARVNRAARAVVACMPPTTLVNRAGVPIRCPMSTITGLAFVAIAMAVDSE